MAGGDCGVFEFAGVGGGYSFALVGDGMSADEVVRAMSYAVMIAAFGYIGVRVWNATVMPEMLRRPVAVLLWLQGAIYALIMIGLLLLRLAHPVPALLR